METPAKTRQRRKDARPQEILAAAIELFSERGYAATQMSEIAARAGVAKGTVYLYFKTKQEVFEGIVKANMSPVLENLTAMLKQRHPTAEAQLATVIDTIYTQLVESPSRRAVFRVLISAGPQFPELVDHYHREVMQFAKSLLTAVMQGGRESGEFRDCPAVADPRVVIGPAILAMVWTIVFDRVDPLDREQFRRAHLDLVLNGLRAQAPRG